MNQGPNTNKWLHEWVDQAQFSPLSQTETLDYVLESIGNYLSSRGTQDPPPAVVFDLDSTLFDVTSRTLRILKEFARSVSGDFPAEWVDFWRNIRRDQVCYTIEATAKAAGFPLGTPEADDLIARLRAFWFERFFAGEYALHDQPAPGARDYVRLVEDSGAHVIYLTGRDVPQMEAGTRVALRHWGFPTSARTTSLAMKAHIDDDDVAFKDSFLASVRGKFAVLSLFDNEPANFAAFAKNFPEAALVFRHSSCSQKQASPVDRLYKIYDFRRG